MKSSRKKFKNLLYVFPMLCLMASCGDGRYEGVSVQVRSFSMNRLFSDLSAEDSEPGGNGVKAGVVWTELSAGNTESYAETTLYPSLVVDGEPGVLVPGTPFTIKEYMFDLETRTGISNLDGSFKVVISSGYAAEYEFIANFYDSSVGGLLIGPVEY